MSAGDEGVQPVAGSLELLSTKLRPPQPVPGVHGSGRLTDLLDAGTGRRLTLVAAPAGYGKTTLVASWFRATAARRGTIAGWLSLEASENDPALFLRYLVAALRAGGSDAGARTEALLMVPGADLEQALTGLINDLAQTAVRTVLVLEDYHVIGEQRCHDLMTLLIDRAPPHVDVLIVSRSDPPLALGSLRAAGRLVEVRERDLRLTAEEVAAFVRSAGLDPADDELAVLVAKTEGWVAALQLAVLWLRRQPDLRAAIREFAGDHRHLVDYLGEQVLADLDSETEEFLLRTSILSRFSAGLCEALIGAPDAGAQIARIERANLFLVSLDDRREWYRYHHLFGELLQAELVRRHPDLVRDLNQRAYRWHRRHGSAGEALRHAMLADDPGAAAEIMTASWATLVRIGRSATLRRWASMFSPAEVAAFPQVAYIAGVAAALEGAPEAEVARWLRIAEEAIEAGTAPSGPLVDGSASFAANVDVLRAAFVYRDIGAAISAARRVLDTEPPDSPWIVPGHATLGFLLYLAGDHAAAERALTAAMEHRNAPRQSNGLILALATRALMQLDAGDGGVGQRSAARALEVVDSFGLGASVPSGLAQVALGRGLQAVGRPAEALRELEAGHQRLAGRAPRTLDVYALLTLAEAQRVAGDLVAAHHAADEAEALLDTFSDAGVLADMLRDFRRRALAERRRRSASPATDLTETELSLLRLLAGPGTRREIAEALSVSPNTVKTHTSAVYRKLGVRSRGEAVARAHDRHLL